VLLVKMKGVRRKQACVRRAFLMQGMNFKCSFYGTELRQISELLMIESQVWWISLEKCDNRSSPLGSLRVLEGP
jgi:hypothetical protein